MAGQKGWATRTRADETTQHRPLSVTANPLERNLSCDPPRHPPPQARGRPSSSPSDARSAGDGTGSANLLRSYLAALTRAVTPLAVGQGAERGQGRRRPDRPDAGLPTLPSDLAPKASNTCLALGRSGPCHRQLRDTFCHRGDPLLWLF